MQHFALVMCSILVQSRHEKPLFYMPESADLTVKVMLVCFIYVSPTTLSVLKGGTASFKCP